jgi:hypothetical protein
MQADLEPPKDRDAKPESKSLFSRFKAKVTEVTDTVADEWHRFFGVE